METESPKKIGRHKNNITELSKAISPAPIARNEDTLIRSSIEITETRQIDLIADEKPMTSWFGELRKSSETSRKASKEIMYRSKNP